MTLVRIPDFGGSGLAPTAAAAGGGEGGGGGGLGISEDMAMDDDDDEVVKRRRKTRLLQVSSPKFSVHSGLALSTSIDAVQHTSQYSTTAMQGGSALVDKVPLIKSPSFWVPPPVSLLLAAQSTSRSLTYSLNNRLQIQLPPDIHPLPDNLQAYVCHVIPLPPLVILVRLTSLHHTSSSTHTRSNPTLSRPFLRSSPPSNPNTRND